MPFISEKLRTRIRDIIFGRTKIKLLKEKDLETAPCKPIFVIGCFRSGTTLLRYFLDSHPNIACPPESRFLFHLSKIQSTQSTYDSIMYMGFDDNFLRSQLKRFADSFFTSHMLAHGKRRWADKTPEYVYCLDFIEWLYGPDCQYVFIFRNGLDVANSINSFPYFHLISLNENKDIYSAFNYWHESSSIMIEWLEKHKNRCFVILYENMCLNTEAILRELFYFLDEEWDPCVLKWYEISHDIGFEDIKARRQRKIRLSHGNFNLWDSNIKNELFHRSFTLHKKIGYDPELLMPEK